MTPWLTGMATAALAPAGVAAIAVAVRQRFVVVRVSGRSMLPTFQPGDRVIVQRGKRRSAQRGQVVVFEWPRNGRWQTGRLPRPGQCEWLIKRVTAVPGDPVSEDVAYQAGAVEGRVPDGMLVVIGDGRFSIDSRSFGFLPADRVLGVVVRRISKSGATEPDLIATSG